MACQQRATDQFNIQRAGFLAPRAAAVGFYGLPFCLAESGHMSAVEVTACC
jgi:hypothetical protein